MKSLRLLLPLLFWATSTFAQENLIGPGDLTAFMGKWEGSLTYTDYSTGKPFTMPANVEIEPGADRNQIILNNVYPNETIANNEYTLKIDPREGTINGKRIIERKEMDNGQTIWIIEYEGTDGDDNQKAMIRETYTISPEIFITQKEVLFEGETRWMRRNIFSYRKVN